MSRFVLGVEHSLTGRPWCDRLDDASRAQALAIAQSHGLPDVVARVLAGRGVTASAAEAFLEPKLRTLLPEPFALAGMETAVARLAQAVQRGETVAIFGDYDVDGAASAAILGEFLAAAGAPFIVHIPDRLTEGYGPSEAAVHALAASGARLLVMVDCGTTGHAAIAEACRLGLDSVVLDHHQAPEQLPGAVAVVNPNRQDDVSGLGHLCAAGVVFITVIALNRQLRQAGFWAKREREPDLFASLDLVALGTVADVVPLVGLNRAFVRQGLAVMRARARVGLRALMDAARLDSAPEAFHLGFLLGPRINAGGRIGDAGLGVRLLLTQDEVEARSIAADLDRLNRERQVLEQAMVAEAEAQALGLLGPDETNHAPVLVAASAHWHPGIVGLVAARLKERFRRPAFALAMPDGASAVGSGRSVPGVDLGRAIRCAVEAGLLLKGGGHAMAGGVTLPVSAIEAFRAFLIEKLSAAVDLARSSEHLAVDAALTAAGASPELVKAMAKAGPFGSGHPEPVVVLPAHRVVEAAEVGAGHVRVRLKAGDASTIAGIAFRAAEQPLGQALLAARGQALHVAGHLAIDRYGGGERVQLRLCDAAKP
jgi:single-stranded-DNA-specific exonuclease